MTINFDADFYVGLRELAESAFPKRCGRCGREYQNATDFLTATRALRTDSSGLKQSLDDDGQVIVDLFRNCICGSTLLESFQNRRDLSEQTDNRRKMFDGMVKKLVDSGLSRDNARAELLKFIQPADKYK